VKKQIWSLAPRAWICLALGLITLAIFWPSVHHDFLAFDDQQYVTENPRVQAGLTGQGVVWAFRSFYASNWHPLTWLSHMADCQFYGLKPAGHHVTNVLLHTANALLLFLALSRMTGAVWRSACVAALFAWHPLHVESVAWVAERKDVLSTFFFMLTLMAYARYVEKSEDRRPRAAKGALWYILALVFFACGLMSKPMLVTVPFVLLLLDYWPWGRFQLSKLGAQRGTLGRVLAEKVPFLVLSGAGCALTIAAQRQSFTIVSVGGLPLSKRIPHVLAAYVHYLGVTIAPRHLAAHYPYVRMMPGIEVTVAGILLGLLTLQVVWLGRRRPYLLVGWLWYLGTLVPVIGLVQVGDQAWADRYTYVPLIGIFIAVVWLIAEEVEKHQTPNTKLQKSSNLQTSNFRLQENSKLQGPNPSRGWGWAMGVLAAGVGVALMAATSVQLGYWKNTRMLFEHAAAVTQKNTRAITMLGSLKAAEGKLDEAKRLYAEALSYSPDNPETHFNLGKALDQEGKLDEAIAEYSRSLWARQWQDKAHLLIGMALAKQKKYEAAIANYEAALALNPESATAENNLARVLHSQGRLDEAIQHYERALKLDPQLAQAHNNLGVLLLQKGRLTEGAAQLKEAVRLKPDDVESEYNLALAFNQAEQWQEAAEIFSRLAPGRPNDPKLHCEYGLTLAHLQQTREAMSHYARALRLQPDYPEALDRLSWIAATDPRAELRNGVEAVNMAERACELTDRKRPEMLLTLAAAYAESGRFSDASAAAQGALVLAGTAGQTNLAGEGQLMLESFRAEKPWREAKSPGSEAISPASTRATRSP
jgi:tetratricopeptide (TPR) repeat protein